MMDEDTWASLPADLLVEIFRGLGASAALAGTRVCKPWRRVIIDNAARWLRPRPDCFAPRLLLGFIDIYRDRGRGRRHVRLQRLPSESPAPAGGGGGTKPHYAPRLPSVAVSSSVVQVADLAPYDVLVSSRDGLLLLLRGAGLCLCSLVTGDRKLIPTGAFNACTYVLLTGYDLAGASDAAAAGDMEVSILAVKEKRIEGGITYQTFSTRDGAWGDVTRSPRFQEGHVTRIYTGSEVICRGGAVHWLAMAADASVVKLKHTVALDVRTGRTWLTALPEGSWQWQMDCYGTLCDCPVSLATSRDGRLSVLRSYRDGIVEVWVLAGSGRWALRRKIEVPYCLGDIWFSFFGPRSGCLLGNLGSGRQIILDAERGSCCLIRCLVTQYEDECMYSYEMDWPIYLASLKHF
ncbi:unnamed protein product [Urochloa decumbens]|uniref:F-box domain-containing protein n=1 Tax=Urochloa decumbens TaxID=240449 RepID=A0ABC8VCJ0_9POAL